MGFSTAYISFTSSDPTIVSVDDMAGIAQALKTGTAIITATTIEGKRAACQIEGSCPGHVFGIIAKRAEQETDGMLYRRACTICGEPNSDLEVIHASRSIWLPGALTSIEPEAFLGSALMGQVWIPEHVTVIGEKAFADCENLFWVYTPNSVQTIGDNAFQNSERVVFATEGVNAALSDHEARHSEISVVHMW